MDPVASPPRPVVGRLAPTPSGQLHLGNVLAFGAAWLSARAAGGRLLLRVEDLDDDRARDDVAEAQRADLVWLGLEWDEEVPAQSTRRYDAALAALAPHTFRCRCTRRERAAHAGHVHGCDTRRLADGAVRLRLPERLETVVDRRHGAVRVDPAVFDEPVLVRRDGGVAYPLAVVVDDHRDGVTEVVRGGDLLEHTAVQQILARRLGWASPTWLHVPLILGPDGRKLSKSHGSTAVGALRAAGHGPRDVWRRVLPWLGLDGDHVHDVVDAFDPRGGPRGSIRVGPDPLDAGADADEATSRSGPRPR